MAIRALYWLVGLAIAILIVAFALSNREAVTVAFWPLSEGVAMPAYAAMLVPLALGVVLGLLVGGLGSLRHRWRARGHARRADALEREIRAVRAQQTAASAAPPANTPPPAPR